MGVLPWHSGNTLLFVSYLLLTGVASALKAVLPGLEGTVSVNFVFFLVGIATMTISETLALALAATLVQCFWRAKKRVELVHFAFNLSQVAIAITGAYWTYAGLMKHVFHGRPPLPILIAALVYFLLNTAPVATVIALVDDVPIVRKWTTAYYWTLPYYLIGAAIAGVILFLNPLAGWEFSILVLPAIYVIYRSYLMHLGRWEDEKRHLEDLASLNMRTIETLALAIEAKDHTTGDHLQRVRVYAMELGKDLGLSPTELQALQAASVLHDIGKLAVPEHIISKPGKLTPEEFEKMKIHPIVGAEILEQIRFPYPVAPIVRCHHEKWDGSGYPAGISGDEIPIGARILSAVDCLDALASDRQYRRALPLDEAMAMVARDSGKAFDPRVVSALQARYRELEQLARSQEPENRVKLSLDAKVERGAAPDAGFAAGTATPAASSSHWAGTVSAIADLGSFGERLSLQEILSAAAFRLRVLVPFDAIAVFAGSGKLLSSRFALGENMRQLSLVRPPMGEGLIGWVAETGNPIINGNPTVDPGLMGVTLRSALAIPLQHRGRTLGVLAVYQRQADAFNSDHLSLLQANASDIARIIKEHPEHEMAEDPIAVGLPYFGHERRSSATVRPEDHSRLISLK
jgi:putative nucleotidyltransferase with HDIG domain